MSGVDLFLFDLDGTVTREELLPRIAREIGESEAIADLTRRTIMGDVPFESSLRERVRILGKVDVSTVADIVDGVEIDPTILNFLRENANRCRIVTGNLDAWLVKLAKRLPVPIMSSEVIVSNGRIVELVRIIDKAQTVRQLGNQSFCAIGEGHNDLGMFELSKYSVAYGGVHDPAPSLLGVASHVIYSSGTLCRFLSQL